MSSLKSDMTPRPVSQRKAPKGRTGNSHIPAPDMGDFLTKGLTTAAGQFSKPLLKPYLIPSSNSLLDMF